MHHNVPPPKSPGFLNLFLLPYLSVTVSLKENCLSESMILSFLLHHKQGTKYISH